MNMLKTVNDPTFVRQIEAAILEHCKEVHELSYIEHGEDNIVALVNRQFTFRFPRTEISARRLVFETAVLQQIKGKITAIAIPEPIQVHTQPLYTVAQYIQGEHVSDGQISAWHEEDQQVVGKKVAEFLVQLQAAISGLEVRRLQSESYAHPLHDASPTYLTSVLEQSVLSNTKLKPVAQVYYERWKTYIAQESAMYAIHGSLRSSEMLFSGCKLQGVIDFSDVATGSIEAELSGLYSMGVGVLQAACARYSELTSQAIDLDHVKTWAIIEELAIFAQALMHEQTTTPRFATARHNLQQWVPEFPL